MSYRAPLMTELVKLSAAYANFTVWDPFDLVCPGQRCANITDEGIAFHDESHLSDEMVRRLGPSLRAVIERVARVTPRPATPGRAAPFYGFRNDGGTPASAEWTSLDRRGKLDP